MIEGNGNLSTNERFDKYLFKSDVGGSHADVLFF